MAQHQQTDPVIKALNNQYHAVLVTGSNLFDLQVELNNPTDIFYRPQYVAEKLFGRGYNVLRYSRSSGFSVYRYQNVKNKSELDTVLKRAGISNFVGSNTISPTEVIEIFRGFKTIAGQKNTDPFAFIVDYAPHLTAHQNPSIEERIVAETLNDITTLPVVKKSGNVLVVYSHEEANQSSLLKGMYKVSYGYPILEEYEHFISILQSREEYAKADVDIPTLAKLSRGLNLTQIAAIFKEAAANHQVVGKENIISEKERLIEQISENTLNVLPTELTFDDMAGLEVPKGVLKGFAEKLSVQDKSSPRAILLAGPPGTGKSTIVSAFANACGFNLVELSDQIKSMWVGESESRLNLALNLIEALSPVILFIDEIDQTFSNRSSSSLDGGVSSHYLKTLFKFAARDDLRGKICIVGCSNTPQLLDPAMINRFVTIPLLEATPVEIAAIFPKIEKRVTGQEKLDPKNETLLEASSLLYSKGASPRQIFDVINHTITKNGVEFHEQHILQSCQSFRTNGDPNSGAFSSLSAINLTAFDDYFPWANNLTGYNFPWYLDGIVDKETGKVNELELHKKIEEFGRRSKF
ncbi:MAG: ATP-binding protein [Saprospiraceae bacterium]|jgi:AAA+ superfamily predicted ATPase|nr:MAG: ATP-binding protein [Saprospiraceae bacterium]